MTVRSCGVGDGRMGKTDVVVVAVVVVVVVVLIMATGVGRRKCDRKEILVE